jgi:hypothetical protein
MGRAIVALIGLAALAACTHSNVRRLEPIDQSSRSITVPAGTSGALGGIKDHLQGAGWTVVVDLGARTVTRRTLSADAAQSGGFQRTRYRLYLRQSQFSTCLNGPALSYDLSIVDNSSGTEVLTMAGRECGPDIVSKFAAAIAI